jgi:hypothetical protein
MCYKEFIAYQCGHRSLGVVRPCPLTTAGHNFPVCGIAPDKPHYAETMCTACERQLHSRWVLIREWEHRWLHERGVCGCEVTFPGLLATPRVIGETSAAGPASSTTGTAPPAALEGKDPPTSKAITAAEGSNHGQAEANQGDEKTTVDGRIPALFSEGVTDNGEHRVAIRLPGLYAAEWHADHRALHDTGKCSCPTTFTPFQPQARGNELTPSDQSNLCWWREVEDEVDRNKADSRDIDGQVDETMKRLAEIDKAFGKFKVDDEPPPKVKLPRLGAAAGGEPRSTDTRSQGSSSSNNHGRHHNPRGRFHETRRRHSPPTRPHNNKPPTQPYPHAHPQQQHHHHQLIISSQPTQPHHHPFPPSAAAAAGAGNGGGGYVYPEPPPHTTPYYFTPAHPTYATPATFTDTIPHGAHPWAGAPTPTPGMPWMTQGPGPYRTSGFSYDNSGYGNGNGGGSGYGLGDSYGHGNGNGYGNGQVSGDRQLPPPVPGSGSVSAPPPEQEGGNDNGNGKGKEVETAQHGGADTNSSHHHHHPLCGLPIGAGPEGTSHMPSWLGCPLRGSASTSTMVNAAGEEEGDAMAASGAGGEEGTAGTGGEEQEDWDRESEGGSGDGDDSQRGEDGEHLPPSPPQRRHSAAT